MTVDKVSKLILKIGLLIGLGFLLIGLFQVGLFIVALALAG